MSEPFLGEIIIFAGTFAPRSFADCDGQILPINQNQSLFSLLGTQYGGDGRTTFALPDLRGRGAMHEGSGPGLTARQIGARGGSETETLSIAEMPSHSHQPRASTDEATTDAPGGNVLADGFTALFGTATPTAPMNANAITGVTGEEGGEAHNNMMPFLTVRFCIALFGLFPSRN